MLLYKLHCKKIHDTSLLWERNTRGVTQVESTVASRAVACIQGVQCYQENSVVQELETAMHVVSILQSFFYVNTVLTCYLVFM